MSQLHVVTERAIPAPADRVYRAIADFSTEHPKFLPPAFSQFRVEEGGVGAPLYDCYRELTSREIPVVILRPTG